MNFKKILVLVMTFAMLLSTFAPTLGVFAGNYEGTTTNEKLNYVSIGDSMTNGYGFEGYLQGKDAHNFLNGDGTYGAGSYALQLEEYFKGLGYDVNHTKLAASALRAEDLLYLLGGRDYTDDWYDEVEHYTGIENYATLSAHYQNAVKNADFITLGIGNASFGAFMLSRLTSALGVLGGSLDDEQLETYTLENALDLVESQELKEQVLEMYNKLFEELNKYVDAETAKTYKLSTVCEIYSYIVARFLISYAKSIDKIVEINEKENLEIMLVGLMNTTYGMVITLDNGDVIPFGDIMDEMFGMLNSYIAAYPAAQQAAGNYEGVTFYYAENTQPDFIVNALDDLKNAGWTNVDGGRLSADIVRERTIRTFNGALAPMISMGFVAGINAVIEGQVKAGVDAAFPSQYAAGVEAGVLSYFRGEFGVDPDMMDDATFKAYIYDNGYGDMFDGAYNSAYAENYDTEYNKALDEALEDNLLPSNYALLPEITLDDVKAYEASTPASWNSEYFFMNDADRKNLAVAVYLGIEDAIVNSVELEEIPLSGLTTIAGDLMSVFDGFAPSTNSPEDVHADIATFFSSDSMLPLIKIFAIFKIGDGMCVHPTPTGHDDTTKAIIEAYESDWTVQKQTIKNAMEYYMGAYELVDEMGYIDLSVAAIDEAIAALNVAINEVEAGLLGVTEELKAEIVNELKAVIATLEEVREVLATDAAGDVEGLVAAVLALEDDLYTHLTNLSAILAQAGLDIHELVLVPGFNEAIRVLNEVVIPAAIELAEYVIEEVVEFVQAKVDAAYRELIAILVRIQLHVQDKLNNAVAPIINAYFELVDTLKAIYGTVEEAIRVANAIFNGLVELDAKLNGALSGAFDKVTNLFVTLYNAYGNVEDALAALNTILMNVVNTTEETIANVIEAYDALVNKLVAIYGTVEEALAKAAEIYNNIVNTVNGTVADALALYNTILNVLVDTYGTVENVVIVAGQLFYHVYDFLAGNITAENLENLFNGIVAVVREAYGTSHDVYYVAAQVYAYILNAYNNAFEGNYIVNDDSMYVSLGSGMYGEELAEMLGLSDKYMNYYLDEEYLDAIAEADLITVKFDNGEALTFIMFNLLDPTELDWDKYLDAQGQVALAALLDELKAEFLANGQMVALSTEILESMGLVSVTLTDEVVAEYMTYAVECLIYCYAEFIDRITVTLGNIYTVAPDATVVITGIQNPLADLGFDLGEYGQIADLVVDGLNLHLIAAALVNDNTIFVESEDAQDIFNALNVVFNVTEEPACNHVYSDCLDTTCNLCGAVRVAGHSFTNYVSNNDASCGKNATKTAKCDNCDATSTIEIPNTALEHQYGEWVTVTEATTEQTGLRKRTCSVCGHEDMEVTPVLPKEPAKVSPWMIAAIVGLLVLCVMIKKKPAGKKTDKKVADKKSTPAKSTSKKK